MYFFADIMYVHGKIHALFNGLFRKKDYVDLINSRNFNTFFPGLKLEFKKENFTSIKELLFRQQIVKIILLAESNRNYHLLFDAFLKVYELNNIKILLARSFGKTNIIEQWNDIYPHQTFNRDLLERKLTPEIFTQIIEGTYIENIIQEEKDLRYEIIESKLDFHIINIFFGFARYFQYKNKSIFQGYMARKLHITQIIWRDRLHKNYQWPLERTESFINDIFIQLSRTSGLNIFREKISKEVNQVLNQIYDKKKDADYELSDIEYKLDKYFWLYAYRHFNVDFHKIYSVISYLWLLYYQIENINKIIEGIRCDADPEILTRKIICEE